MLRKKWIIVAKNNFVNRLTKDLFEFMAILIIICLPTV